MTHAFSPQQSSFSHNRGPHLRQCIFEPLNRLDGKLETIVVRLLCPTSFPKAVLGKLREDVSRSGSFSSSPFPLNLLAFQGLWVGGAVRASSHPDWQKILVATVDSLELTRQHCVEVFSQSGKPINVSEALSFYKRNLVGQFGDFCVCIFGCTMSVPGRF